MKKYILFALFAFWMCNALYAQPYKLFRPFVDYLYIDANNYYNGFRIIKTDTSANGDSILIPFQEKNIFYRSCTHYYASWISYQIIQKSDGTSILFNQDYDSIKIKTQAQLNEGWDCYHYKNGARIEARISKWENQIFLGLSDSAKTISFAYYDETNARKANRIDSLQIILSKNYGMVQTMNFMYFPDLLFNGKIKLGSYSIRGFGEMLGEQNMNIKNVYNYQVGDEMDILQVKKYFDTYDYYFDTNKIKQKVLQRIDYDKYVSYQINEITFRLYTDITGTKLSHKDTTRWISYTYHSSSNLIESLPGTTMAINGNTMSFNVYSNFVNNFNDVRLQKSVIYDGNFFCSKYGTADSCYGCSYLDSATFYINPFIYIEGLGGGYFYDSNLYTDLLQLRKLVYYKKGAETWGVPLSVKPEQIHYQQPQIQIFPNPWESSATVSVNSLSKGKIQIITQLGQVVYEKDISSGQNTITIYKERFNSGVYFLKLTLQNGIQSSKIFVVQ